MIKGELDKFSEEIVKLYQSGIPSTKIAKIYGCSGSSLCRLLHRRGVSIREMSVAKQRYNIISTIFDKIDTEEKAYWLGFLFADGYNSDKDVKLLLQKEDEEILEKFSIFLGTDKPIRYENKKGRVYAKVVIENKRITDMLKLHGVIRAKTHALTYPTTIAHELNRHFIRGYFDGDGCVQREGWSITGRLPVLNKMDNLMQNDCNFTKEFYYCKRHKERCNDIWTFSICNRINLGKVHNYLYTDSVIFLARKKDKFDEILSTLKSRPGNYWKNRNKKLVVTNS